MHMSADISETLDDYDQFPESDIMPPPPTPGLLCPPTPGQTESMLSDQIPLTPGLLPMTPGGGMHGNLTPSDLAHGLQMTPADLQHGGLSPAGLSHGMPMTPGHLSHSGMTPIHLSHGGMTSSHLSHSGMTPRHLSHDEMTPTHLSHGDMTPVGLSHGIDADLPMPQIPADQVSSLLDDHSGRSPHDHSHTTPHDLDPVTGSFEPVTDLDHLDHVSYDHQGHPMQMANMGYDEHVMGNHTPRPSMSERVSTPWHEDYDFSPSVGHPGEEQLQDETDEQFEERVLNKRAAQLFNSVKGKLLKQNFLYISEMARSNNKKQAAQKFYSLLVLKKAQVLDISQEIPCGDIRVTKGLKFDNPSM